MDAAWPVCVICQTHAQRLSYCVTGTPDYTSNASQSFRNYSEIISAPRTSRKHGSRNVLKKSAIRNTACKGWRRTHLARSGTPAADLQHDAKECVILPYILYESVRMKVNIWDYLRGSPPSPKRSIAHRWPPVYTPVRYAIHPWIATVVQG